MNIQCPTRIQTNTNVIQIAALQMVIRECRGRSFGSAASNESIIPTHNDRSIQTIVEMATGQEKLKWPEKPLPVQQYSREISRDCIRPRGKIANSGSRNSVVGIVTSYELDDRAIGV